MIRQPTLFVSKKGNNGRATRALPSVALGARLGGEGGQGEREDRASGLGETRERRGGRRGA